MKTGFASVTFRNLDYTSIVLLAKKYGLNGIEWGSDVHAIVGDYERATNIYLLTRSKGLDVLSYGSYYRLGESSNFDEVLRTAVALHAPIIRVWAGSLGSFYSTLSCSSVAPYSKPLPVADDFYYEKVAQDANRICSLAKNYGISISTEYHRNTLTDTAHSALKLLGMCDNLRTYWQPNPDITFAQRLLEIDSLLPFISNIHVFAWEKGDLRFPLSHKIDEWEQYTLKLGTHHSYILEFVKNNDIVQFQSDCNTLLSFNKLYL